MPLVAAARSDSMYVSSAAGTLVIRAANVAQCASVSVGIRSKMSRIRDIFDLMPTETDAHWATFAARMTKVPAALDTYMESLRAAATKGMVSPKRQVEACAAQCVELAAADGYFAT